MRLRDRFQFPRPGNAHRANQNHFEESFTAGAAVIDEFPRAYREGRLVDALPNYTHPPLLVIDAVGYLSCRREVANVLFHVVNDRRPRRHSVIFALPRGQSCRNSCQRSVRLCWRRCWRATQSPSGISPRPASP